MFVFHLGLDEAHLEIHSRARIAATANLLIRVGEGGACSPPRLSGLWRGWVKGSSLLAKPCWAPAVGLLCSPWCTGRSCLLAASPHATCSGGFEAREYGSEQVNPPRVHSRRVAQVWFWRRAAGVSWRAELRLSFLILPPFLSMAQDL